ncbi:piggyBac transposable element-derived protein 4-like [Stegodyphus dumicola]|uniref:piggyBac transposable element-derived protein 4-like n=1 Tax=Stegodyphus dumicola TaxID=202533 RepID=UPI0015B135EE|nr:piggyBac transposable element-derived protein 4-like [Stegodyphus dumicola]
MEFDLRKTVSVTIDGASNTVVIHKGLAKSLLISGLFSVGTVRPQRKDLPPMLKANNKLQRGESMFLTKEGVAAIKWMDKKAVTLLTTAHNSAIITSVNRTQKDGTKTEVPCPKAVAANDIMGGVHCFDQRKERYQIGRRSVEWWHRKVVDIEE